MGQLTWDAPTGLIAVVRAASAAEALTIGRGLAAAGVLTIEITLTVPDAADVIRAICLDVRVGAGTVLDSREVERLIDAGASFIVSPVLDEGVLAAAARCAIPAIPGALTPNEILQAHRAGAAAVKVFPIGSVGGVAYIRSINEPFTDIPLVVSGGIQIADVSAYLAAGCRAVCLGGALIDRAAAKAGDIGTVTAYARAILATS